MIQTPPQPDTTPLKQIVNQNRITCLNITDFKIVDGLRMYKIEWEQLKDGQPKFKWQKLVNLQPFIDSLMTYEQRNKQKVKKLESEWQQYFYDGQVNKPLQYNILMKYMQSDDQDMLQDNDSDFQIGRRRRRKLILKKQIKSKPKKKKKKRRIRIRFNRPNIKMQQKQLKFKRQIIQHKGDSQLKKQGQTFELLNSNKRDKKSKEDQKYQCLLDWQLQIPYVQLDSKSNQVSCCIRPNQVTQVTPKKELEYVPPTLHQSHQKQSESDQQQQQNQESNKEDQYDQVESYILFTSQQQNSESDEEQQSYEKIQQKQSKNEKPQNMRQFIKQQMKALNIQTPAELLGSSSKLKLEENYSDKFYYQYDKQRQNEKKDEFIYKSKIKQEQEANVKKQDTDFSQLQLSQQSKRANKNKNLKQIKDQTYKYIYQNIMSAEQFQVYRLPKIISVNRLIKYCNLILYSVNIKIHNFIVQKFLLPEVLKLYYFKLEERFLYDNQSSF